LTIYKTNTLNIMKQTRSQWAIIALFLVFSPSLSAQSPWTTMQKELFTRIVQLLISAKKAPATTASTVSACVISNEITITIAPCGESVRSEQVGLIKPIQ
jgi:hypothetical protein